MAGIEIEIDVDDPSLVVLVGAAGSGKSHLRRSSFRTRRDPVVRPFPGDRLGRRSQPGGDQGRLRPPPSDAVGQIGRGAPDRGRRDERAARGPARAGRSGGRIPCAGHGDRPRPPGRNGPREERGPPGPDRGHGRRSTPAVRGQGRARWSFLAAARRRLPADRRPARPGRGRARQDPARSALTARPNGRARTSTQTPLAM